MDRVACCGGGCGRLRAGRSWGEKLRGLARCGGCRGGGPWSDMDGLHGWTSVGATFGLHSRGMNPHARTPHTRTRIRPPARPARRRVIRAKTVVPHTSTRLLRARIAGPHLDQTWIYLDQVSWSKLVQTSGWGWSKSVQVWFKLVHAPPSLIEACDVAKPGFGRYVAAPPRRSQPSCTSSLFFILYSRYPLARALQRSTAHGHPLHRGRASASGRSPLAPSPHSPSAPC